MKSATPVINVNSRELDVVFVIDMQQSGDRFHAELLPNVIQPLIKTVSLLAADGLINASAQKTSRQSIAPVFVKYGAVLVGADSDNHTCIERVYLTSNSQELYTTLTSLKFAEPGGYASLVDGIVAAMEMFQVREDLIIEEMQHSDISLPAEFFIKHCVLVSNSLPSPDYVRNAWMEQFDGVCLDNLKERLIAESVNFSLISLRPCEALVNLVRACATLTMPVFDVDVGIDDCIVKLCGLAGSSYNLKAKTPDPNVITRRGSAQATAHRHLSATTTPEPLFLPPTDMTNGFQEAINQNSHVPILKSVPHSSPSHPIPAANLRRVWQGKLSIVINGIDVFIDAFAASSNASSDAALQTNIWPPIMSMTPVSVDLTYFRAQVQQQSIPVLQFMPLNAAATKPFQEIIVKSLITANRQTITPFGNPGCGVLMMVTRNSLLGALCLKIPLPQDISAQPQMIPHQQQQQRMTTRHQQQQQRTPVMSNVANDIANLSPQQKRALYERLQLQKRSK